MITNCIAIDFDGVLRKSNRYDKTSFGEPSDGASNATKKIKDLGYDIIIHTCRGEHEHDEIAEWCEENDIKFDYINHSPINRTLKLAKNKPNADYYIDDKAIRFEGDWESVLCQIDKSFEIVELDDLEKIFETGDAIRKQRTAQYGNFQEGNRNQGLLWTAMIQNYFGIRLPHSIPADLVSMMMAGMKAMRAVSKGVPFHGDNYVDMINYTKMAAESRVLLEKEIAEDVDAEK